MTLYEIKLREIAKGYEVVTDFHIKCLANELGESESKVMAILLAKVLNPYNGSSKTKFVFKSDHK